MPTITRLADVIQPEVFTGYVIKRTMELSALLQSGIVSNDTEMDTLASGPHTLVHMPHFVDLSGESDIMEDDGFIKPDKIGTSKDVARKQARTKAWGANGLSALLSGADPMNAIGDLVATWWSRDTQRTLLAELAGVFASDSMTAKVLNISGLTGDAATINASTFVDANQLMGDAKDLLTAVAMHSAVEAYLAKQQLIEYEETKDKAQRIPYFMGKRVIVDDGLPFDTTAKVATAYLFGTGAFSLGNGTHPRITRTELVREGMSSSGEDYLVNRRVFILHPRGVKWTEEDVEGIFPTNAELADAENWKRVVEEKALPMSAFTFKIG